MVIHSVLESHFDILKTEQFLEVTARPCITGKTLNVPYLILDYVLRAIKRLSDRESSFISQFINHCDKNQRLVGADSKFEVLKKVSDN